MNNNFGDPDNELEAPIFRPNGLRIESVSKGHVHFILRRYILKGNTLKTFPNYKRDKKFYLVGQD